MIDDSSFISTVASLAGMSEDDVKETICQLGIDRIVDLADAALSDNSAMVKRILERIDGT